MTLYLETSSETFTAWRGEAIEGVRYPLAIEQRWNADKLAEKGLYAPAAADPAPEGKIVTGTTVQRVSGVVKFVHALADKPVIDWDQVDQDELNRILAANGSVLRALAELTFEQINNLRTRAGLTAFTKPQFVSALKAKMRV